MLLLRGNLLFNLFFSFTPVRLLLFLFDYVQLFLIVTQLCSLLIFITFLQLSFDLILFALQFYAVACLADNE